MKQEYNKIEYTSNVEYTNYYSSNLNTGTFPLKHQLKNRRKRKVVKEEERGQEREGGSKEREGETEKDRKKS